MSASIGLLKRFSCALRALLGRSPRPSFEDRLGEALRSNDHVDLNAEELGRLVERQLAGSTISSANDSHRA